MKNNKGFQKWITTLLLLVFATFQGVAANYLCFTAEEANSEVRYIATGVFVDVQYSLDGVTWSPLESNEPVTLAQVGDKVYFKGENSGFSMSMDHYVCFRMTGRIAASGSVMSLLDGLGDAIEIPNTCCFARLFSECASLVKAPELPATVLTDECYASMFDGCSGLTEAPELPATNLAESCYSNMFNFCSNLTKAPVLPATHLEPYCYEMMFRNCTSLQVAPSLNAKELASHCYSSMFFGCSSLTQAPVLPADQLAEFCYSSMFSYCESLTEPPALTSTQLAKGCYSGMFSSCTSLKETPALPAMELTELCYSGMFNNCKAMEQAPQLPATKMAKKCYSGMFSSCESLAEAPELPAMDLAESCYESMFTFCQGLTKAPVLPATTLAPSCYSSMFNSCRNMTEAPELPAMTLTLSCYERMFAGCWALQKAPELPAAELVESCYKGMFSNCSSLNYIKVGVMSLLNDFSATDNWVKTVDNEGIFIFPCGSTYEEHGPSDVPTNFKIQQYKIAIYQNPDNTELWRDSLACGATPVYRGDPNPPTYGEGKIFKEWKRVFTSDSDPDVWCYVAEYEDDVIDATNWLFFTAKEPGTIVSYKNVGGNSPNVQYSLNMGGPWSPLAEGEEIRLENVGDRVFFKGNNRNGFSQAEDVYTKFEVTGLADLAGSVMSLIDEKGITKKIPNDYCFTHLFENCNINEITDYETLPATSLKAYCYSYMFASCTKIPYLVVNLPATELAPYCYYNMFTGCTDIHSITNLPATELKEGCYSHMFSQCVSLGSLFLYSLPATKLVDYCYDGMFSGCDHIYETFPLPAVDLAPYCYRSMFSGCKSLRTTPFLHAQQMEKSCYANMFQDCTQLDSVFVLPSNKLSDSCYQKMFANCTNLKKFPPLPAVEMKPSCYDSMFSGCVSLVEAPELPATELVQQCYRNMFEGCSSLNYIKVGVLTLENDFDATTNWVKGVDGPGLFIFPCGSKYNKHGDSEVPMDFDIISSPIVIFQNPDGNELWRDTIACDIVFEYKGATPTYGEGLVFRGWDKRLEPLEKSGLYYYTAEYNHGDNPDLDNTLFFVAEEAGSHIWYISGIGGVAGSYPNVQYSKDEGKTWKVLEPDTHVIFENKGDKIYFKGNNPTGFSHGGNESRIYMSGRIAAYGSVMSLIDGVGDTKVIPCDSCFSGLFSGCHDALTRAPKLPAMELRRNCYQVMFGECTGLTEAPELPATELADYCYGDMFRGSSLTSAPVLPAMKLAKGCYSGMFSLCNELTGMPELPATELASGCYASMFSYCGNLSQTTELPAMKMEENCYCGMFSGCLRLRTAPKLPASKLAPNCYAYMFSSCKTLVNAPELPVEELDEECYAGMFYFCECLRKAPELLATELKRNCYESMFYLCSKLNYIKVGVTTLDNDFFATKDWVFGVNGDGLFIFPCGSKYDKHGDSEVPTNFTIVSSPIVIFQNPDGTELQRDTIDCETVPEYRGAGPTYGDGLVFKGWDPEPTLLPFPDTYYYTAQYEDSSNNNWLCFTAESDNASFSYLTRGQHHPDVQYSTDGGATWQTLEPNVTVEMNGAGKKVYLRGNNPEGFSLDPNQYSTFIMEGGEIAASGSVMSLVDGFGRSTTIPSDFCFAYLFEGAEFLTHTPELPATVLRNSCYESMFRGCSSLSQAPELPATTLANKCYSTMFSECVSLEKAPELPATVIAFHCYYSMFYNCKQLKEAPKLPAENVYDGCYSSMFEKCSSLVVLPDLPATEMTDNCYSSMFKDCALAETAPALPAMSLARACYDHMFSGCSSLSSPIVLPAENLEYKCYNSMFQGCSNLNYIEVGVMTLDNQKNATDRWVEGIDGEGLFVFPCGSKYDKHGVSEVPTNFTIVSSPIVIFQNWDSTELQKDTINCVTIPEYRGEEPIREGYTFIGWDPELSVHPEAGVYYYTAQYKKDGEITPSNWLCFTAEEAGSKVWYENKNGNSPDVQFSTDGGKTWQPLEAGEEVQLKEIGDKVYFKGNNPDGFSQGDAEEGVNNPCTIFRMTGYIAASGSVMSLIDGEGTSTVIPNDFCFAQLFHTCTSLTQAPDLPATQLTMGCYENMFYQCASLKVAPELPATQLAERCYSRMFMYCESMTQAPKLPALEMKPNCYSSMFLSCRKLENAPALPATSLANGCYAAMFHSCQKLVVAPELPATTLARNCYSSMFYKCYALTQAPELPATKMEEACYANMFSICESLVAPPDLPADILAEACYEQMFSNCASLSTAPELPATELVLNCYAGMFENCTTLVRAPELPATQLVESAYNNLFNGCISLNYIKVGLMSLDNDVLATYNWVKYVDGPGTFIFPCGSKYDKHGDSEVPTNFTIVSSPIVVFRNPDGTELQRDTIDCKTVPEYRGKEPTIGEDYTFKGWDNDLTVLPIPDTYYYTAVYEKKGAAYSVTDLAITACDSFVFQGIVFYESASWNDTLPASNGVDSITAYHLTVHKSVVTEKNISAEESYTWKEFTFTEDASWEDTLTTAFGCDSIVRYQLIIKKDCATDYVTDVNIPACDSFVYKGITYHESKDWNDTLFSINGCDSIVAYHLTIHKSVVTEANISAEGSYTWKEITFTEDASWNDTLQTAFGCDSIVMYHLDIKEVTPNPATVTDIPLTACDSLVFEGVTYRESAEWNDTLPAANGGDSILAYHLTIHKSVVTEANISAEGSYTWKEITFTEDASWNDTLQTAFGCDSIVRINLVVKTVTTPPITVDKIELACDSFVYNGITYRENSSWNERLKSIDGGDSIVSYRLIIHKSVVKEENISAKDSYTWKDVTYTEDASWNDTLQTAFGCDSIVRYHLTIEKEKPDLQLTVNDKLYLVLPGGSETISYELTGGEGSKYEVRYNGQAICSGNVANDSTVSLNCPSNLEPGAYNATLEMCDDEGNCAEKDFTFNVMRPDDKTKSFYVKVWNDVVICRNADGQFQSYQWYKNRKMQKDASLQYLNDIALLDGEYMVFVKETSGKSYFIEPVTYAPVEAAYAITAEPNVVARNTDFTLTVTGVDEEELSHARIVVYRADGVVEKIVDEVEAQSTMRLKAGEYVIVLTVRDGKNANCKVLSR